MKKEIMPPQSGCLERVALWSGSVALIAWLIASTGCATEDVLTREAACREQAELWCERIGHSNESCEIGYAYQCAPSGTDREAPIAPAWQGACLDALACEVDGLHHTVPHACKMIWNRP